MKNLLLYLLVIHYLMGCGPTDRECDRLLGVAVDGEVFEDPHWKARHNSSVLEIEALRLETQIMRNQISKFTRDTVLMNLRTRIEIQDIRNETNARLCGCQ